MIGDKRTCGCAAGNRMHDRRFDFQEVSAIQNLANAFNDLAAQNKSAADFRINDQVNITLTITHFYIFQAMPFFRQRPQRFGKQFQSNRFNRQFAHVRTENCSGYTDNIADIHQFDQGIVFFAQGILTYIKLNTACFIHQIDKAGFAMTADSHNAAGQTDNSFISR